MPTDVSAVAQAFAMPGAFQHAERFGHGHINDTFRITCEDAGRRRRYILQRINTSVFTDPAALMENSLRVVRHIRHKLASEGADALDRRVLAFVPTRQGGWVHEDQEGGAWRMCRYVEGSSAFATVSEPWQAEAAGEAFGRFQQQLIDLPGPPLHAVIPGFHDARRRFDALQRTAVADVCGRAAEVHAELAFATRREGIVDVLNDSFRSGALPVRTVHNDAKLDNLLFDAATGEALCVVDLDTVMPGTVLYDVGDLIRTAASTAAEDAIDPGTMSVSVERFEALLRGYLTAMGAELTAAERDHLVFGGQLITFVMGLRFLTDYLAGDAYYKTERPRHNLDRCRAQFALVASIEARREELQAIVHRLVG